MKHLLIFCFSLFSVIAVGQIRPDQFTEDRSPVGADAFYTQETVGGIPTPRKIRIDTLRNWMITSGNIVDRVELLDSLTGAAANNDSLYIVASQTSLVGISSPAQNDIALNTAKDTFFIRDGASWVAVPIGGGSGGVYVAETQGQLSDPNQGFVRELTGDSIMTVYDARSDKLEPVQTRVDFDSLNRTYLRIDDVRNNVKNTDVKPGDVLRYAPSLNNYVIESYPRYDVDTVLTIPIENKGWENQFNNSDGFPVGAIWTDFGDVYSVLENDTIHPTTLRNNVNAIVLGESRCRVGFDDLEWRTDIYEPESIYTFSFWARQGANVADANVSLTIQLGYSGNPDPETTVSISSEWQYYNVELTAFDSTRVITFPTFEINGDIGDKIYITDVQLNSGSYSSNAYYKTTGTKLLTDSTIYANYFPQEGYYNYEDLRGVAGGDAQTLNYLSSICQSDPDCGGIKIHNPIRLTDQVILREHVSIEGDFKESALSGSNNYLLESSRIVADLNDASKSIFISEGTSQVAGINFGGFVVDIDSPAKSLWESADDLGARIHNITIVTGGNNLENGIILNSGSLESDITNVSIKDAKTGMLAIGSTNVEMKDCQFVGNEKAIIIHGGDWDIENCWIENIDSSGIDFYGGGELIIRRLYTEAVPKIGAINGYIFRVNNSKNFEVSSSSLNIEPGASNTNNIIVLDTIEGAAIYANDFSSTPSYNITTTINSKNIFEFSNSSSSGRIIPENFEGIADSSQIKGFDEFRNWIPKLETTGANIRDSYVRSSNDKTYTEGEWEIRNDTLDLIGNQNLLAQSENISELLPVSQRYIFTGGSTGSIESDFEGNAELIILGDENGLRADNLSNSGVSIKTNTYYTLSYEAKLPTGSSEMIIQPQMALVGQGDTESTFDTITTSWVKYEHLMLSPESSWSLDFAMEGDSVLLTKVQLSEGFLQDEYVQTTTTPILKTGVVLDGDFYHPDLKNASFVKGGINGELEKSFWADIPADSLGVAIVNDGDGTASTASGIGRVDFLDTIAVARDHGLQIGATGDTPTGVIKYELSSNYLKGYGTADWNIGSETNGIAFHVDNNNRNIGIRTAIPSEALEVNGNAKADSVFIDEVNVQRLGTDANGKIVAKEWWSNQIVQNSNSPYTGTESITDYQINGSSGTVTLELPQGTNMRGRVVYLMRTDDNPLETITINTASGAIRGSADVGAEIANRYSSVTLRSNGTDWWVTAINNN